jgi:uncharacterized membrane protein
MHRSRPFVLVILAAAAACSKHDPAEGNDILSQDRTLAAHLGTDKNAPRLALPGACGAITAAAAPTVANQQQAEELTQQAGVAEMHGNIQDARALLRRAATLDATNKSAAYHLGRTSEALGDRSSAMTAYCRYLALAPTAAESVEARQRLTNLSRSVPRATASATDSVAARHSVAAAPRSATSRARVTHAPGVVASGAVQSQPVEPQTTQPQTTQSQTPSVAVEGDVVAARPAAPVTDPSPAPSRTQRRTSIGVQSAIIGAATGAIFGAATGRSVKSAVIGAAAGGVLGTVVGTAARPTGRSVRS